MRLLHLIDDRAPGPGCVHLAMLSDGLGRLPDIEATVALIGGDRLRQAASAVGIQPDLTLSAPFGGGPFAWPALRHHLRRLGGPDRYDLVHAWTPSALKLAATLLPDTPRLLTVSRLVDDHSARRLRAIIDGSRGRTHVLAGSNTVRRSLCSRGVPEDAVDVLRPGLDFGRVQAGRRDDLREAWNIGPDHRVVAVLGDDPARTHAMPAMLVGGIHAESRPPAAAPVHFLVHPDADHRRRASRTQRQLDREALILTDARLTAPWEILPGCDAALALGEEAPLAMLWAMAANVPLVGEATYATSEILEDRHSALLAPPDDLPALAERLGRLEQDTQLAWSLRDTARHEAYSFFSRRHYCEGLAAACRQMHAGEPIELPELESTGGMRFTGRG